MYLAALYSIPLLFSLFHTYCHLYACSVGGQRQLGDEDLDALSPHDRADDIVQKYVRTSAKLCAKPYLLFVLLFPLGIQSCTSISMRLWCVRLEEVWEASDKSNPRALFWALNRSQRSDLWIGGGLCLSEHSIDNFLRTSYYPYFLSCVPLNE